MNRTNQLPGSEPQPARVPATAAIGDRRPAPAIARPAGLRRLVTGALLAACALDGAVAHAATRLDAPLVVTQVPAKTSDAPAGWSPANLVRADAFDGARLVVLSPEGQERVLSTGFQSACDPNVSFDGQRVLFAGRKAGNEHWRIWEIGLDGTGLRAISPEGIDARQGIYVSLLNTLESPQPWSTIVFVGRESTVNEVGRVGASALYNVKLDGSELRRLTYNPNHNLDPVQMWDGRVIYAAERYPNEASASPGRVGLYAIHIEGADMELYGGELGQRIQRMPCPTSTGLLVFVESSQPTWDGAGQLACVEQRRPHVTYRSLTKDAGVLYAHPAPLEGSRVLVAQRPAKGRGTWAIAGFDTATARSEALFDTAEFDEVQAVVAQPRREPDGHSTVVVTKADYGTLYGLDCYTTDAARAGHLKAGEVKLVRLIEGVVSSSDARTSPLSPAVPRRLIGEAAVEKDGSFNLFVPSDTPLLLQTVDENGLALGTCGWFWVKPKEKRGCIGCHEDPERVPENNFVLALHHDSIPLLPPVAERRTVTFARDVAPILQRLAAGTIVDARQQPLRLAFDTLAGVQAAYQALTQGADALVEPGRARTSRLIWQLTGRNTSRPWDAAAKTKPPVRGTSASQLSADDLRTIILWIDLGAQFDASPETDLVATKGSEKQ